MQSRSSLENHTQFHTQTNLGQSLYPFSDQNGARAQPFGAAHTYMAYTRENPPPPPGLHSLSSLREGTLAIVVYHLHWQTGRSTVLANCTQNSGLENFVPESRLPFVQISSIYRKTTVISNMALKKWNTNFRLEHSVRKNRTTFSNVPLLSEIFLWNDPKSRVPFTFKPDFPETWCKNNLKMPSWPLYGTSFGKFVFLWSHPTIWGSEWGYLDSTKPFIFWLCNTKQLNFSHFNTNGKNYLK